MRLREVAALLGVTRQTVLTWRKERGFPSPVTLSPGCRRFRGIDVARWIEERAS
jgi:predicted DNA-binding transcriptional regulator AlpA